MISEIQFKERIMNQYPKVNITRYDPKKINTKNIDDITYVVVKEGVMLLNVDITPVVSTDDKDYYFVCCDDLVIGKLMNDQELRDYVVVCEKNFKPNTLRLIGMDEIQYCNTHSKFPE